MKLLTFDAFNYTVEYFEPQITFDPEGNGTVTGFTNQGEVRCALGNTTSPASLQLITNRQLNVEWTVGNLRDAHGNPIWFASNVTNPEGYWDIIQVIPRLNFYGFAEGYVHTLNPFRAGRLR